MSVPYWVQDTVFYQIFVDRFMNGDTTNDPGNLQPWGSPPTGWGFQGGDLRGIIQRMDYLLDLGINALYLTPIFQATSVHRYNTYDYFKIDPKVGTLQDFQALVNNAHANKMRVIIDGVFNHVGRGFFAFNDVLENQDKSPYKDWFQIYHFPVDAYSPGDARDYAGWWKHKSLPKLNTAYPKVRNYIMSVVRYWTEQGVDGWRLDVPNEIDDDSFWDEFRRTVRSINPDAYLVGEIWEANNRWVNDTHFDGLMDYPIRTALLGVLTQGQPVSTLGNRAEDLLKLYPDENTRAMLLLVGSHDTERIVTLCQNDIRKVKLAYLYLMVYPGAPCLYYGDEIGLEGGKDPDNRRAFPWDMNQWKQDLRAYLQRIISCRKQLKALRRGKFQRVMIDDQRACFAFARILGDESVLVAMNFGNTRRHLRIPIQALDWSDGKIVRNLIGDGEYIVSGTELPVSLDPWSGILLA